MNGTRLAGLYRVCVKCYAAEYTVENDAELFVPIFHDWIRDRALDLVMLDVADYAHAPDSPGIVLVCHEASFALDRSDGRLGLLCQRRLPFDGTASEGIAETVRQTLDVAARLEADPRVMGKLRFDPTRLRIEANDRLLAPNSSEGYRDFAALVRAAIATAFGAGEPAVEKIDNDPRDRLALFVRLHAARG
ncbi:MAG: hypothetical protein OXT72_00855 [Gammaproteobacteria bacterium]|nr:hypothetical protein [Gammaproteobacteria bacterium]